MSRQFNAVPWVGSALRKSVTRSLRRRLAATTILATVPFLAYGRQAYAACEATPPGSATFICSGDNTTEQLITTNNADVSTAPGFSVVTTGVGEDGVEINALGHLRFTDNYGSTLDGAIDGLDVRSSGDYGGTASAVTIVTNGTITGTDDGIDAYTHGSGLLSITANGDVSGTGTGSGIAAAAFGAGSLKITTGADSHIEGGRYGIRAQNFDGGDLDVTVEGEVVGQASHGIYAENGDDTGNLTVETKAGSVVTSIAGDGIRAYNDGDGAADITAEGEVHGGPDHDGIKAYNSAYGTDLIITTGAGSAISGGDDGIQAVNHGNGNLEITVEGTVTGENANGISAINSYGYVYDPGDPNGPPIGKNLGIDLIITTSAASVVTGAAYGILATNNGTGNLKIAVNGEVTGGADGIYAQNGEYADNLTITTGADSAVTGGEDGIEARNFGTGILKIEANGDVTGNGGDGIFARALDGDVEVTTGTGSAVTGLNGNGISAYASVSPSALVGGDAVVKTQGTVSGTRHGIDAEALGPGGTVLIETAAAVTGGSDGIDAAANSDVTVKAGGDVTGGTQGINAVANSGNILVTTAAGTTVSGANTVGINASASTGNVVIQAQSTVTGGNIGIDASTDAGTIDITTGAGAVGGTDYYGIEATASGEVTITTGGDVRGGDAGIHATSALGNTEGAIEITNNGTVANLSGDSAALAIRTSGGATDIENNANLIGTVDINGKDELFDDTLENFGLWNTADGVSGFGGGEDRLFNSGTLRAADDPANNSETTELFSLEFFSNSGLVSLVDGGAGDTLTTSGENGTAYTGDDGRLAVDAVLGAPGTGRSDQLIVNGFTTGKTFVVVNVVDAAGANSEGIPVVVVNGLLVPTLEEHFDLAGPVNAGFFTWDLRLDDAGGTFHELYTSGIGLGASEFAAGIGGAQEVWQQTMGTIHQRQADLRVLLEGTSVTPVADYSEPVAPTPVANITPGFWFRGVGAYIERDDEEDGFTLDREQTVWGGMAGFDFGHESAGSAWLFGIFAGYLTSDLEFDATNTEWNYEGPTVGAYVTYLDHGFYADLTVKADFLDIDIDPEDLAPASDDADTDATNLGGRIDTGYKFGETFFIEPQATLAVVHTEIDDVDIFGGEVEFDDETSVRGRLGLRLGFDQPGSDGTVYSGDVTASVWEDFSGDNDVSITDPDPTFGTFGASDDPGQTYGDVALGFSVAAPEGWSGFIRGNYLFAEDYEAVTGNAGVRWAW